MQSRYRRYLRVQENDLRLHWQAQRPHLGPIGTPEGSCFQTFQTYSNLYSHLHDLRAWFLQRMSSLCMVNMTALIDLMNITVKITSLQTCFTSTLTKLPSVSTRQPRLPRTVQVGQKWDKSSDLLYIHTDQASHCFNATGQGFPILSELDRSGMPDQWRCKESVASPCCFNETASPNPHTRL